jgi:signal transduction histidine kinase
MKQHASTLTALRIAVTYVAVALLWIATSDTLLMFSVSEPQARALLGSAKGGLFVLLTGSVLFTWVRERLRERDVALGLKDEALLQEQAASLMLKELARISTSPLLICDRRGRIMAMNAQAMIVSGMDEPPPPAAIDNLSKLTAHGCSWLLDSIEQATQLAHAETVVESVELATGPATLHIFRGPLPGQGTGKDTSSEPLGYFVSAVDVTELLKVEQALKTSQRQLAELTQRLLVQDQITTQKVAQTLHDDLGQRLYACTMLLEPSPTATESSDPKVIQAIQFLEDKQAKALSQVQATLISLRAVLVDLRPPFLEDGGVISALKYELARIYPHGSQIDLSDLTAGQRWQPHIEYGVFMIAREAVLNAIQHANAQLITTQVKWAGSTTITVTVQDDGSGISEHMLLGRPGHLGITGMRERAASLGGQLHITSTPGHGAKVCFEMRVHTT